MINFSKYILDGINKLQVKEIDFFPKNLFDEFEIKKVNNFYNVVLKKTFLLKCFQNVLVNLTNYEYKLVPNSKSCNPSSIFIEKITNPQ